MVSIADLKAEIAKEKGFLDYERNESESREEKIKLQKELKELRFQRKYGKKIEAIKPVGKEIKSAWNKFSDVVGKMQQEQNRKDRGERGIFG